jgi:hypothetical protein
VELALMPQELAVCRLDPEAAIPGWASRGDLVSVTRTPSELSVICAAADVPAGVRAERGWQALVVTTPMDFATTGVAAAVTTALAEAGISVLPLATHDTDYFLVKSDRLDDAIAALRRGGHAVPA